MKTIRVSITILTAAGLFFLTACGGAGDLKVKNMVGAYTAEVAAPPGPTIAAARNAAADMKFTDITATSTAVDGRVAAHTPHGDVVSITISQVDEHESNVTVRVGGGDEATSMEIIRRIKSGV